MGIVGDLPYGAAVSGELGDIGRRAADAVALGADRRVGEAEGQDAWQGVAGGKELDKVRSLTRHGHTAVADEMEGLGVHKISHGRLLSVRPPRRASFWKDSTGTG